MAETTCVEDTAPEVAATPANEGDEDHFGGDFEACSGETEREREEDQGLD